MKPIPLRLIDADGVIVHDRRIYARTVLWAADQLTNAAATRGSACSARANQFRTLLPGSVHFEEPPPMSSERVDCRRKADEARQRAAQASEPFVKSAYEKVAEHWMLLARLDTIVHDETITKPPSKPGP